MSYKPASLVTLINEKNRTLFLPHIQRPFVWEWDQVVRFLDSLMKNYPIQTFLFWKTRDAIRARKFMDDVLDDPDLSDYYEQGMSEAGREKIFVLDGQQRLQSLFGAFDGGFEGKELYINILDGQSEIEDGLSYRFLPSATPMDLPFFRIRSLLPDRRNAEDIADEVNQSLLREDEDAEVLRSRERQVRHNVAQLVSLLREDKHFWIEQLDGVASAAYPYRVVLNIFIRVNSGGTKLGAADLMFAAMKEAWADIETNVEDVVDKLNDSGRIYFDKTFVLKCLMLVSGKGATLGPELFQGALGDSTLADLERDWAKASPAFDQLRDFITNDLKLYSDKVIRSYNAFIPVFEFFFLSPSPSPETRELLKSYYYRSQLFNWYSARTDQILDVVHTVLTRHAGEFPLAELIKYFGNQDKPIELTRAHLSENRLRYILLNLLYVEQSGSGAFDVAYKGNEPHIDHIFPKSRLKGYPTYEVNHVGNYRLIGASDNLRKRAEDPASYFSRLKAAGVDIRRHLLVDSFAENPNLLIEPLYSRFREERLERIFEVCARVVNRSV